MKINLSLLVGIVLLYCCQTSVSAQTLTTNYEVQALEQGKEGTVLMKVFSYGKTTEEAIERAKLDAVHAVLFKGIPGSNCEKPLIGDLSLLQSKADYFKTLFGVDELEGYTRKKKKIRYGTENAPYRLYVSLSTDGSIDPADRLRVGKEYKVGVSVSVQFHALRAQLEKDGIIKAFGF